VIDPELITEYEDKINLWSYLMTQYNLKPGLRKFGESGATAAIDKLTQYGNGSKQTCTRGSIECISFALVLEKKVSW
jgi:hypothetical protein